ncbi:MAG: hypothetical protein GF393_06690, partial [Armatimonadia bacterium]|nr:hypothetical protein [Armatimonadia bacterium]
FDKVEIVTEPARSGEHALKVTLDRVEHVGMRNHRTDFWIRGMSEALEQRRDCWYAVSTFVPEDWRPDTQAELWVQWVLGKTAVSATGGPSLAIYVYGDGYRVRKRWGPGREHYENIWLGDVLPDRGCWVDWVFHVRWAPDDSGRIEVWRNGEKVATDNGRNCVAADYAPYLKFGIYKWPWKRSADDAPSEATRREIYFDEIRIADERGSYASVSLEKTEQMNEQGEDN